MTQPLTRRTAITAAAALALAGPALADSPRKKAFPKGFLWGAATAGHQVEGNNVASDLWLLENITPTTFKERSGDAVDSLNRWPEDLDLCRKIGLNSYRFSLEWARIEPVRGQFSTAMLDHYGRMVAGCRERGLKPVVTFNHFTAPAWFSAAGNWTNKDSPDLFARFCDKAARAFGGQVEYALTFNEPQLPALLKEIREIPAVAQGTQAMFAKASQLTGGGNFLAANEVNYADYLKMLPQMQAAHRKGREAIKAAHPKLPVGLSLAVSDDQAVGSVTTARDAKRRLVYEPWFEAVRGDDFVGVQNYGRSVFDANGPVQTPAGASLNASGQEIYAPSLQGAVRYIHAATGRKILVTEHGVSTPDDRLRAKLIAEALPLLHDAIADGVPVLGYIHWSLLDNFEWVSGFASKYGLVAVDLQTFRRTPKPSAAVLGGIARRNAV